MPILDDRVMLPLAGRAGCAEDDVLTQGNAFLKALEDPACPGFLFDVEPRPAYDSYEKEGEGHCVYVFPLRKGETAGEAYYRMCRHHGE